MDIDPRLRHFRENLRRKISKKFLGNKIWGFFMMLEMYLFILEKRLLKKTYNALKTQKLDKIR